MLVNLSLSILLVALLFVLNAALTGMQTARRNRLEDDLSNHLFGSGSALGFLDRQDEVVVGIRCGAALLTVGIVLFVGVSVGAENVGFDLSRKGVASFEFGAIVLGWAIALVLVGDVIPSRLAGRFPEVTLRFLSPVIAIVLIGMRPFTFLVRSFATSALGPTPQESVSDEDVEEEIKVIVDEGQRAGVIDPEEKEIINRVFKLDDKPVASLMTPRGDVVFLDRGGELSSLIERAAEAKHTWYPVRGHSEDEVVGLVTMHGLVQLQRAESSKRDLSTVLEEPLEVPESMSALKLLELFRSSGAHFAVVRDEYGGIAGIATVYDVLQVIVGDIGESSPEDRSIIRREDGSFLVDASSDVRDLFDILGIADELPFDGAEFHSLGGFVMTTLGYVPKEGERFDTGGYTFEVIDMDNKRIDKVLVCPTARREAVGS